MNSFFKKIINEPLVHFVFIGLVIFFIDRLLGNPTTGKQPIVVTDDIVNSIIKAENASTDSELKSLINNHVISEISYREALSLGFDKNDVIVKRRLLQKYDFFLESKIEEPTEKDLREEYATNPETYTESPLISFEHIYFKSETGVFEIYNKIETNQLPFSNDLGDAFYAAQYDFDNYNYHSVQSVFGSAFTEALFLQEKTQGLKGPFLSGYGYHIVRINEIKEGELLPFEEIQLQLNENWKFKQVKKIKEKHYERLFKKYRIVHDLEQYENLFN